MNTFRFRLPLLAAAILASACMKMPKTKIVDPVFPPPLWNMSIRLGLKISL